MHRCSWFFNRLPYTEGPSSVLDFARIFRSPSHSLGMGGSAGAAAPCRVAAVSSDDVAG